MKNSSFSMYLALLTLISIPPCEAADIKYRISGVSDVLLENVAQHVNAFSIAGQVSGTDPDHDRLLERATTNVYEALRPYGYYRPSISGRVEANSNGDIIVELRIEPGPPVVVDEVAIELVGDGQARASLTQWRDTWPLGEGRVLDQTVWEERKQFALHEAEMLGYLGAAFTEHRLQLDLSNNTAKIVLILDTGERYRFGDVVFGEHVLRSGIMEYVPRFDKGDPFSRRLVEKFRLDLWKTSYFTEVVVEEVPRTNVSPPVVDLKVVLATEFRNTYQGSIGLGSDTGIRLQAQWGKHPMSSNGDRLDIGAGWQQQDNEFSIRGSYRLPRRNRARQYWVSDLVIRHESIDLEVRGAPNTDFTRIANGTTDERHLRVGRLKVRNFRSGEQQALETFFVQGLSASDEFRPLDSVPDLLAIANDPLSERLLKGTDKTLSVGFDYDMVAVYGKAWDTIGHRERGWIFSSSEAFGSDRNFLQAYFSTRRSYVKGDRWKFIVRAEAGYTDAKVAEYALEIDGEPFPLSVTTLPNFYRFKAGGSSSVRGYGFEELSNNHIGSNHIISASAEIEMKVLDKWSGALFYDIGNAFNDWSDPELKSGAGFGVRWYSIAGPIRLDVARGLDLEGKPWRVHFTIGTPLL